MSTPRPHEKWCKSMPREFDAVMGRGPYKCDCGAEGVAAPLEPSRLTAKQFWMDQPFHFENRFEFAEAYAAAVSKNLTDMLNSSDAGHTVTAKKLIAAKSRILELEKEIAALTLSRKEDAEWINKKAQAKGCFEIVAYSAGILLRGEITALRETK